MGSTLRIAVLEKVVAQAKANEQHAVERYKSGGAPSSDALMATAGRLEAEIALERAKLKGAARTDRQGENEPAAQAAGCCAAPAKKAPPRCYCCCGR